MGEYVDVKYGRRALCIANASPYDRKLIAQVGSLWHVWERLAEHESFRGELQVLYGLAVAIVHWAQVCLHYDYDAQFIHCGSRNQTSCQMQ